MEEIMEYIKNHFYGKKDYFKVFIDNDSRVEGWFKGELIYIFTKLEKTNIIDKFICEKKVEVSDQKKRKQIDFYIKKGNDKILLEIKSLSISERKTKRNLNFYFRNDNIGILNDVNKLESIGQYKSKWILAFIYSLPNDDVLKNLLNDKKLKLYMDIKDNNGNYLIALIQV